MTHDDLHEEEAVTLVAVSPRPVAALWKTLRSNGFAREDDVFLIPRSEKSIPPWQHDAYVEIDILRNGREIFGHDDLWDTVSVMYPLARVPETGIPFFVEKASELAAALDLPLRYRGEIVTPEELHARLSACAEELRRTIGVPGSEDVAIHIEARYPRP